MENAQVDIYAKTAHNLVDRVIESAIRRLEQDEQNNRQKTLDSIQFDHSRDETFIISEPTTEDYDMQNINWLSIGDFSPDKAEQKIHQFIKVRQIYICHKVSVESSIL